MGDAAGIGPEIIVKALAYESIYAVCQPIVVGSSAILQDAAVRFTPPGMSRLQLNSISTPAQAVAAQGTLDVLNVVSMSPQDISVGTVDARAGAAAVTAVETATHLAVRGELDAITTAPICKAAVHRAGLPYPGHTEMLAAFTNASDVVMMFCTAEALGDSRQSVGREQWSSRKPSVRGSRFAVRGILRDEPHCPCGCVKTSVCPKNCECHLSHPSGTHS